jgi:methionyl-tRNA formyltransferase
MGTPEFAVAGLEALVQNGYDVVAVITAPDKPAGRGMQLQSSEVKVKALELGIPILQPIKLKDPDFLAELASYKADLQIVVAFRMLPEVVWNMPPLGTFNLHASLLPQYRGAAPINWAIINGETKTGVTTFFLQHEIDTGDIILQKEIEILPNDNLGTLYHKLMTLGSEAIIETAHDIKKGSVQTFPQKMENEDLRTAPKIFKEHCQINWANSAVEIHNLIRGLNPIPAAWTTLNGKSFKIFESRVADDLDAQIMEIGQIHILKKEGRFLVKTGNGSLELLEIQPEGKKRIQVKDYINGLRSEDNLKFD